MLETDNGARMPFVFPESGVHSIMALLMIEMLRKFHATEASVVSAGYVQIGTDTTVHGGSTSLEDMNHNPADAARLILGDAVQFMPDEMATMLLGKLTAQPS